MKRKLAVLLTAVFCASLAGCGSVPPARAADGADWSDNWVTVGNVVGVDTPAYLEPRENLDTLSVNGMYYATWSAGEPEPFVNGEGEDAELYDACLYLLLAGYNAAEKAEDAAAEWLAMARERYDVQEVAQEVFNGQAFTVVTYTFPSETNPYDRGASAFGVYRNYAISAELSCRDTFGGEAWVVLDDFLRACHYAT